MIPIVLHIPHASREVPDTDRVEIVLCETDLQRELLLMTDAWTDELLKLSDDYAVTRVIAPVSRLVCDVERFRDDDEEDMSQVGMGAVYIRTSNGRSQREPTAETRIRILETYYDPHHALLTKAVDEALEKAGWCLIIDLHSFPSSPLPYEHDQSPTRPDVCIGFDEDHGHFLSDDGWRSACECAGFTGEENRPFYGSIVPAKYLDDENVLSVMIEVRRDLYMDERTGEKSASFDSVADKIRILVEALVSRVSGHMKEMTMENIREYGGVIEDYLWDGAGEHTSPGSSFYACVKEWNGLYAWFSDVDSAGPFSNEEEAISGMQKHCQ